MRILHVGKWYPWTGGVETVRDDIVGGIASLGINCDMLCEAPLGEKGTEYILNEHSRVITAGTKFKITRVPVTPGIITKLRKISNQYDIIHVHQPDPIAIVAMMFSGYKGKVVTHWHADIDEYPLLQKLYNPLPNWLLKRSDVIIATTQITADASPNLKPYKDKITIVPIGIKDPKPQPEMAESIRNQYKGKKIIFGMGRLATYKGFNYLIDAMRELPDDYVCLIGGKGPLKDALSEQIKENGLEEKVKLLGFLSDEEVSAYYDACTLFCMPSIHKGEAFGIVQIEGMAHSKPIVTTKIKDSGVPWVNADGITGINVPVMDSHALVEAILKICSDDSLREEYGNNARKRFTELFEKSVMVNSVLKVYNRLLNS